jgi:RNA polymerase sigma factor (TIGR02999 family)
MSLSELDVTTLLTLANQGDAQAKAALYRLVEGELRKRAHARMRHERPPHELQTTVLVDEAFVELVGDQNVKWQNRAQFYCRAARVMRELMVDEARRRTAEKRGGGIQPAQLDGIAEPIDWTAEDPFTVLALQEALTGLASSDPELAQIVDLHHFGGWDLKQIAEVILHIPYTTVKRRWLKARALLYRALSGGDDDANVSRTTR